MQSREKIKSNKFLKSIKNILIEYMPQKILYINHYAGTPALGMEYRPYYLAREWVRAGHSVTLIAANYSHVRSHQPHLECETIEGIKFRWIKTPIYRGNGVGRMRNIMTFLSKLWLQARSFAHEYKPSIVIASSTYPMDIWVARRIANFTGAKLIYEVHDLWPASPMELSGMPWWHPFILMCQKAENDAYRDADHVISMLPNVSAHMQAHGLDLQKLSIVPNGISPEEWTSEDKSLPEEISSYIKVQRSAGYSVIGYAGSHGLPNALDILLDAAKLMTKEKISFVLVGDGHEKKRLEKRVLDESIMNVRMFCSIKKNQVPNFLRILDIAYIGWLRLPIYRFGIAPNKLMDYMMAECTILHSVEAGNDPVADAKCGLTVTPESATAVAAGIRQLVKIPEDHRIKMGKRGRDYVMKKLTYPILAQRFMEAIT